MALSEGQIRQLIKDAKGHKETKEILHNALDLYLETGFATSEFLGWLRHRGYSKTDLPPIQQQKKVAGEIAAGLGVIKDRGDRDLIGGETKGTGFWRLVARGGHVLAVKWDRKTQGREGVGDLQIAFGSGGRVQPNSYPVYQWGGIRYRTYIYLWKEASSPGSYTFKNLKNGKYLGNVSMNKLIAYVNR